MRPPSFVATEKKASLPKGLSGTMFDKGGHQKHGGRPAMSIVDAEVGTDRPANGSSAVPVSDLADTNSRPGRELSQTVLQNSADDDLFKSLLKGALVEHAARLARVTELTVHERLADPSFRQRIESGREALRDSVLSQLSDAASDAVSRLWRLMGNEDPVIQLGASKTLLDSLVKLQQVELNRRPRTTVRVSVEQTHIE